MMITKRQKDIGAFIINYRAKYKNSPKITDIAKMFKLNNGTIFRHLERMRNKKLLNKNIPTKKLLDVFRTYY